MNKIAARVTESAPEHKIQKALNEGFFVIIIYMSEIMQLTEKVKRIVRLYHEKYPEVNMDRDYAPFKITEEWGECLQAYLMLTDRGRQKGKSKEEIKSILQAEIADVFGYLLMFADNEGVDLAKAMEKKWFGYLKNK